MRTARPTPRLALTAEEREVLERWAVGPRQQALAGWARIVLECETLSEGV